jgi:ankyrin repeat protein
MVSYKRLGQLNLSPSSEMSDLMRNLCGVDLSADLVQLGQMTESNEHEVDEDDEEEEEEEEVTEDRLSTVFEATGLNEDSNNTMISFSSSAPSSRPRAVPQRSTRPLSITTVSTQSTGMMSLAPTMSTLAFSATSSTQSRSSVGMARSPVHVAKGGQENIWQCAKKGNLTLVKYHLEKEPGLINSPWKFDGRSVLSSACASSQPQELVEFLVQRGAQVNSADTFYKRTALHTLCEEGGLSQDDWKIVVSRADQEANEQDVLAAMRFLLDNGAVVDAKNHWKETALMRLFAGRDCPLMVQELYSRGADSRLKSSKDAYPHGTALCYAAFYGRTQSLKWMIENDLLLNDEANIKDAVRWAKASKGDIPQLSSSPSSSQSMNMVRKREERKQEAIRLLESWLGEGGLSKRKALAKEVSSLEGEEWWQRMSGIVIEKPAASSSTSLEPSMKGFSLSPSPSSSSTLPAMATSSSKLPLEMRPLWREVQGLSESLSSSADLASSPSSRMKWNPLTMLRK